jgi:maltooligosyltrehalose synthase
MREIFNPVSTYRIQFNKDFTFTYFEKAIPYLQKLGIKTIYASPIFEATPGSMHGYDGTDPNNINPEIGTKDQLVKIVQQLEENDIHWIQDIVPNHLSFHENNKWLMDVLEKGKDSEYSEIFDIDWNHPEHHGKLMVPFPGSSLEQTLKEKFPGGTNFQLCDWRETDKAINYRRFFIVNSLICTNIQNAKVFNRYHELIRELTAQRIFRGLRIDHVDGLYDPGKYLEDLRLLAGDETYIVVEKILEPGENLPNNWPIQGNSGYDFLGMVNNVFTNRESEYDLEVFYYDITDDCKPIKQQISEKKAHILYTHMNGELDNLVRLHRSMGLGDFEKEDLRKSIAEYLISCPVYRYYGDDYPVMKIDEGKDRDQLKKFYTRCMQFTGPLMAKGVEDTLMYTYNRFIGHNEVGDSPEFFGYSTKKFHELMVYRQNHWPLSMNATSTHDTKRGEDARARLNALTDHHEEWIETVKQWMLENEKLKVSGMPDTNDEYFIYQTVIATHPYPGSPQEAIDAYHDRIKEYLQKSLREAKVHSEWTDPNIEYENAAIQFAHSFIKKTKSFESFLKKIADVGIMKSLGQLVLKFTCPGVPDTYQGTELWDLSMVDPDNRRPVDYEKRSQMLESSKTSNELWETRITGEIKLRLLHQLLTIRNKYSELFIEGEYIPLETQGRYKDHMLAFIRKHRHSAILVAVQVNHGNKHWEDTKIILPDDEPVMWEDLLSGDTIEISNRRFLPVSVPAVFRSY